METDKAIEILKKLEDKYGVNTEIKYRLGNKYMSLSMHLESLEYCEKAFIEYGEAKKINESDVKILNNLGFCLLHKYRLLKEEKAQKALDNSILILENTIKIDKEHFNAYFNLGLSYIEKYKTSSENNKLFLEKAIYYLEIGETLEKGIFSIQISRAYSLKGDAKNSLLWLRKSLDTDDTIVKDDIINNEGFNNIKDDKSLNKIFKD
ncbi:tetratricopeptide repeat protein [Tenacibaculum ovolyticum]|uniref:tetratricopeptide repeat protein n=1 Tax=Tenacibaculum ovolyticum TaxID=104270 RepID=UPI003BACF6D0